MSSTPSDGYTPAPLRYPGTGGHVGHRLSARAVLVVILVVVLVAFFVTAGIVFPAQRTELPPSPALPGKPVAMGASAVARSSPTAAVAQVGLAATDAVALPSGVSVTPAAGWTVKNQTDTDVALCNPNCSALLVIGVGHTKETDVAAVLQAAINDLASSSDSGYSNLRLVNGKKQTLGSAKFQQYGFVPFTADVQGQSGTIPVTGTFTALLNPSTGVSAFILFQARGQDSFQQALPDYELMIGSML